MSVVVRTADGEWFALPENEGAGANVNVALETLRPGPGYAARPWTLVTGRVGARHGRPLFLLTSAIVAVAEGSAADGD